MGLDSMPQSLLDAHAREPERVLEQLGTSPRGLSSEEAGRRLEQAGPNQLPRQESPRLWKVFVRQFRSPLIYVLAVAGAVSMAIGEITDAGFIFAVLGINAVIGGIQEWRAEKSSLALQQLLRTWATVLRDGDACEVDAEQLVLGDIVQLEAGARVPADVRILAAHGLEVDESLLTGESLPVLKSADWVGTSEVGVGDRQNMAHAGSVVARGRGRGVVVATAAETVVGRLAVAVGGAGGKPPLLLRLERFTQVIAVAVLSAALLVGVVGVVGQGQSILEMFLFAVALAVSAIPEGLPVALTVALAVGTSRMARRGVIVRKLAAVEGLGSCTLIASDKTGTLTCNELTVRAGRTVDGQRFSATGQGYAPEGRLVDEHGEELDLEAGVGRLARIAVLCNEATLLQRDDGWSWRGDPTDVALLSFGHKAGMRAAPLLEAHPQLTAIEFEPERRFAASFHGLDDASDEVEVLVKGAPERVLEMCAWPDASGVPDAEGPLAAAREMAAEGYRVLAFADGRIPAADLDPDAPAEPSELSFVGLVGMIDPPREGVREAIAACDRAGVRVTMVTGDHPVTALAIARDLGLAESEDEVVTGAQIANSADEELALLVGRVRVFARMSPGQKLEIVQAARKAGEFVAVTGDGVNDAPALRDANIGVAMGKSGTDVAREAAELVISDDNFATIVAGIEEGRVAYDNVRKVIYLLISTGAAEVVLVGLSLAAGMPLPLLPVQLLWLNLVTNGIQDVALAFEPKEEHVLDRPPRAPKERIFDRLMIERTVVGALVIGGVAFAAFDWMIAAGWDVETSRATLLLLMVLFENLHIGNCRSETRSLFSLSPLRSPVLLAGTATAFLVHLGAMYFPPMQVVLETQPVDGLHWLVLLGLALTAPLALELHKWTWARRRGPPPAAPGRPVEAAGRA